MPECRLPKRSYTNRFLLKRNIFVCNKDEDKQLHMFNKLCLIIKYKNKTSTCEQKTLKAYYQLKKKTMFGNYCKI